mmetsp:Transcript_3510/g.10174  ORF Transcript_3510/g.10174 Transcript_3510/m.10174 type:complete len:264 (+) Transcript_3510:285-1076(+)
MSSRCCNAPASRAPAPRSPRSRRFTPAACPEACGWRGGAAAEDRPSLRRRRTCRVTPAAARRRAASSSHSASIWPGDSKRCMRRRDSASTALGTPRRLNAATPPPRARAAAAEEGAAAALQCSLLTISLDLEEEVECDEQLCDELGWDLALTRTEAGGTGARSSRTVESVEVAAAAVREASFELLLPSHLPPSCEAPALTLRWKLRFIFTLRPRPETEAAQTLDWVLPMTVRPAPRRSLARAAAVATPPPATLPLWLEADAPG